MADGLDGCTRLIGARVQMMHAQRCTRRYARGKVHEVRCTCRGARVEVHA